MGGENIISKICLFFSLNKNFQIGTIWGGFISFKSHKNIVL